MKRITLLALSLWAAHAGAQEMSRGEYVARAGDCMACHTAADGAPLAGGLKFATPLGDIYSTNITPDNTHGIGSYSYDEFARAMREGIAKDGHHLYPAMPYPSYAKMNDDDLRALYDYLMKEVKPQATANRESDIPWPLSIRWPLGIWNSLFVDDTPFTPRADKSAAWNRGAYLVQGPGHCGACHTPRGVGMQEKAFDERDEQFLAGEELNGWYAPSLRGLKMSEEDLAVLLRDGRSKHAALSGPMDEVVTNSTQYLTDDDNRAIAAYLLSLPGSEPVKRDAPKVAKAEMENGHQLYARYCATCHANNGEGAEYAVPALKDNLTVNADNPLTLLRVVLEGGKTAVTQNHLPYSMPGYGWALSDQDAADVTNYIRGSFGNHAAPVTPAQVKDAREQQHNE